MNNDLAACSSRKHLVAVAAGFAVALAGPPLVFCFLKGVFFAAPPHRVEQSLGGLSLPWRAWPVLLLTPGLLAIAWLLAGALFAAAGAACATLTRGAGARLGPPSREPPPEGQWPTCAEPAGVVETAEMTSFDLACGGTERYLLNQQEAFHYVDSIHDWSERAFVEAAVAHAISFLLMDDLYALQFKAAPMSLLTYARAVHAFARSRPPAAPPPSSRRVTGPPPSAASAGRAPP